MPLYRFHVGDHAGRSLWESPQLEAFDRDAAFAALYTNHPQASGMVVTAERIDGDPLHKPCGCLRGGLSRTVSVWECRDCATVQGARRKTCIECAASKGANPRGYGCCGVDWGQGAVQCGDMGHNASPIPDGWQPCHGAFCEDDLTRLPHPDVATFTVRFGRDSFTDRRGVQRCAGCLAPEED